MFLFTVLIAYFSPPGPKTSFLDELDQGTSFILFCFPKHCDFIVVGVQTVTRLGLRPGESNE